MVAPVGTFLYPAATGAEAAQQAAAKAGAGSRELLQSAGVAENIFPWEPACSDNRWVGGLEQRGIRVCWGPCHSYVCRDGERQDEQVIDEGGQDAMCIQ